MKPSLFICLGGAGMKIGHALKYNFATYKPELILSPDGSSGKVKFLFIDSDLTEIDRIKSYYRHKQGIFNIDEFIHVGYVNAFRIVERIKNDLKENKKLTDVDADINQWFDKIILPDHEINFSSPNVRQFSRLDFAANYDQIYAQITKAIFQLRSFSRDDKSPEPSSIEVYIITSTCGGIGSGIFLDISALLDEAFGLNELPVKRAVLINTNYFLEQKLSDPNINKTEGSYLNLQINSAAFINECEYFYKNIGKDDKLLGRYNARNSKHLNRINLELPYIPFKEAFIYDINTQKYLKIPLSKFYYLVADSLFSFITTINGIFGFMGGMICDNVQYNALAYKIVKYPQEEFLEYFKTRYLYEIFSKALLNKSLDHDSISKKAERFVDDLFGDNGISIFAYIESDYKTRLPNFQSKHFLSDESRYFNDKNKLLKKIEIFDILKNSDSKQIAEIKDELEQKRRTMPDLGFNYAYRNRGTIADQLRSSLPKYVQEVIYTHGYYGILGINEGSNVEPGFLGEIDRILRNKFKELTRFKNSFDEVDFINKITETKNKLIESLMRFRMKLRFTDIRAEIDAYHNAVNNYLYELFAYNICQLQQEILYYFVVGDRKSDIVDSFYTAELDIYSTELNKYRHGLAVAVGCIPNYTNNSSQSIISVFDKGENDDSDTLRNRYMKFLPNRWNSTRDDIFTVYLPVNLCDYTDPNTADNWKAGSHLDNEFKWNILIDHNELSSIFDNDTEHTNLLSQLGMDLNKVDRNINLILEKINYSFLEKYYNNSSYPIAEYINKTIQDAYYNANEEIKGKIRDQKNSLIYPVCDLTSSKSPELYLIIHPENKEFAKNQLEFNIEKTFEQYTMPKHQMVFVGIVQGINYSDLMGSEENKKVYLERDLNHFRPHINAKWNDYPNGPWDAEKIELNKTI